MGVVLEHRRRRRVRRGLDDDIGGHGIAHGLDAARMGEERPAQRGAHVQDRLAVPFGPIAPGLHGKLAALGLFGLGQPVPAALGLGVLRAHVKGQKTGHVILLASYAAEDRASDRKGRSGFRTAPMREFQSNRLETLCSLAVRAMASPISGAMLMRLILGASRVASVSRMESVTTSSLSLLAATRSAAPSERTPWVI